MFVAQLSSDSNKNLQILSNLRNGEEGTSLELGRFVDPLSFRGLNAKGKSLSQGTFFTEPANAVHYNFTKAEPVVIQIRGMGPTGTTPVKK